MKNPVTGVKFLKDKDGKVLKIMAEYLTGGKKIYNSDDKDIPKPVLKLARDQLNKTVK